MTGKLVMNLAVTAIFLWFINIMLVRFLHMVNLIPFLMNVVIIIIGIVAFVIGNNILKNNPKDELAKTGRLIGGVAAGLKIISLIITLV